MKGGEGKKKLKMKKGGIGGKKEGKDGVLGGGEKRDAKYYLGKRNERTYDIEEYV